MATATRITVARRGGVVLMEIVNDGVREPTGTGTGIAGVVERARAVSGSASTSTGGGRFRLTVAVPEVAV